MLGRSESHVCDDGTPFQCHGGTLGCMDGSSVYCPAHERRKMYLVALALLLGGLLVAAFFIHEKRKNRGDA
uniref:Uncharacterized protein n=1 Tax=viral metagenome TaxID=1070528 RepID=A0A6C0C0L5_9ZZZZ